MKWIEILRNQGIDVKENCDLTNFSTMKLVATGDLVVAKSKEEVICAVKTFSQFQLNYHVIGKGSNFLMKEKSLEPYLLLNFPKQDDYLNQSRSSYLLYASTAISLMTKHAIRFGLKGWEAFTGIPASFGGAIAMNAGTNLGEIGDLIKKVFVIRRDGSDQIIEINDKKKFFSYRKNLFLESGDIIYQAEIIHNGIDPSISNLIKDYLVLRANSQPLKAWTCGCTFKNCSDGTRVGKLLDDLGLKGFEKGHFRISPIHANFIEHLGQGSYSEIRDFIEEIKTRVEEKTGIRLELEVHI